MSHVSGCTTIFPRFTICPHPVCVHGMCSSRHCCRWLFVLSNEPVHVQPLSLCGQKTSNVSTTLSKAIMCLKSADRMGCLLTGQFILWCTFTHCSMQDLQKRWPSLQAKASRITCWLQLRRKTIFRD